LADDCALEDLHGGGDVVGADERHIDAFELLDRRSDPGDRADRANEGHRGRSLSESDRSDPFNGKRARG
jgi:hypothetical protein